MSELIKRQDAIDAVAKVYSNESERMTALQEVPIITEEEIRNKAIKEFAKLLLVKFCDAPLPNSNKWQADNIYTTKSIKEIINKIGSQLIK